MRSFINKWRSVSENTLLGVVKSFVAYLFIIVLYEISPGEGFIKLYIDYEIWAAATLLLTFGVQGFSYKNLYDAPLYSLALFFVLLSGFLVVVFLVIDYRSSWFLIANLVLLDRGLDILLQIKRHRNDFRLFNYCDLLNSLAVKAFFLIAALGHDLWEVLLPAKLLLNSYLVYLLYERGVLLSGFRQLYGYFTSIRQMIGWYAFDILNFLVMNLDLVVVRWVGGDGLVALYFYVRKFTRLPLVLLNYVIDPLYVSVRTEVDSCVAQNKLMQVVKPVFFAMFSLLFMIGLWFISYLESLEDGLYGALLALSSFYLVVTRFADLFVLLRYPQRQRILLRLASLSGIFLLFLSFSNESALKILLIWVPALGWIVSAKSIFNIDLLDEGRELTLIIMMSVVLLFVLVGGFALTYISALLVYITLSALFFYSALCYLKRLARILEIVYGDL